MSFNLAVMLTETARTSAEHPVAVFDGGQLTWVAAHERLGRNRP